MSGEGVSRRRRALVAVMSLFLAPLLMWVLERRAQRRQEPMPRWARPSPPRTRPSAATAARRDERVPAREQPAPPIEDRDPEWGWVEPEPVSPVVPREPTAPAVDPDPTPIDAGAPLAAAAVPLPRPRPPRRRFRARRVLVASLVIIVVVPTVLTIALSRRVLSLDVPGSSLVPFSSSETSYSLPRPVPSLRVVSYYPADAGWTYMWTRYDAARIALDMHRASALGFDTVRIFVPPRAFGFPQPSTLMQTRLAQVIAAAHDAHLEVGLSLFDRFEDYGDVAGSTTWLQGLLTPYLDDKRIAFVELHNEINPGTPAAISWLGAMTRVARSLELRPPLIASVSGRFGVAGLARLAHELRRTPPDAYSLHYYSSAAYFPAALRQARAAVSPTPLIVGELGYSTDPGNLATPGTPATSWAQEAQQSIVLRSAFEATRAAGLPAPGLWTLYDFAPGAFPPDVSPGNRDEQEHYGLLHTDGSPKPAATDVRRFLKSNAISTDINADFSQGGATPTGPQPLDWRQFDPTQGTFAWDSAVGHSAPGSVRLSATGGSTARVPSFYQQVWSIPVRPRQALTLVAWGKGQAVGGDDRVALSWFAADGTYLGEQQSGQLPPGDSDWTRLTVTGLPPKGAVTVQVHLKSAHEPGTVWFDDVVIS